MIVKFKQQIPAGVSEGQVFHALGLKHAVPFTSLKYDNGRLEIDGGRCLYNNIHSFEVIDNEISEANKARG